MIALFLVAAAGAAALMSQAPAAETQVDPLVGAPLPRFTDPAALHARVRTEAPDPTWSPKMEGAMRRRLLQIPTIGAGGNVLRVTCGATICEAAGTLIAPPSRREREDQNSRYGRTIQNLQVSPLPDDLAKIGLKFEAGSFTGGQGKPDRTVFMLYYLRAAPPPPPAAHG